MDLREEEQVCHHLRHEDSKVLYNDKIRWSDEIQQKIIMLVTSNLWKLCGV